MSRPAVIIPAVKPGSNTGLVLKRGIWQACYTAGGKRRTKSLGTVSEAEARARRSIYYAELLFDGATVAGQPRETTYIYREAPFQVKIPGRGVIGRYETLGEAQAARDAALNKTKQ